MAGASVREWREVAEGVDAFVQLPGTWGWSNAGLISGRGESLLVDTLFDVPLTVDMLARRPVGPPIAVAINTHANGDHCYGNAALNGIPVIATPATAAGLAETPPAVLAALVASRAPGDLGDWVEQAFGPFAFSESPLVGPTSQYSGRLEMAVGGREVVLVELGPAHTASDTAVWVPDAGVVFTGDLCFAGGTPIAWAGPLPAWIEACEAIWALGPSLLVPGHGEPGPPSLLDPMVSYLAYVETEATKRLDTMGILEAALDIPLGPYEQWSDAERIVANVATVHRHLGLPEQWGAPQVLAGMAAYWGRRVRR